MTTEENIFQLAEELAAEHLGKSMLEKCLEEMKAMPHVWQKMTEAQQREVLERLRATITTTVGVAIHTLRSAGAEFVPVHVDQLTAKKDMKLTLSVTDKKHHILEHVNKGAILILEDPDLYLKKMEEVTADPDQPELEIGDENSVKTGTVVDLKSKNNDTDSDPLYSHAIEYVESNKNLTISALQRHLRIGYNRAARLLETMELDGIVSACKANGMRVLLTEAAPEEPLDETTTGDSNDE